jgi:hypothetical protein
MEEEIWKDVVGYEGKYKVSNKARIWSNLSKRYLKQIEYIGYMSVILYFNSKNRTEKVHRLMAKAFIPNPENKPQVNHLNGIKNDNRLENFEWVTNSENQLHALRIGLYKNPFGEKNNWAKIKEKDAIAIINDKRPAKVICKEYNLAVNTIYSIKNGTNWKHLKR